jgi:hypothetical protein
MVFKSVYGKSQLKIGWRGFVIGDMIMRRGDMGI